MPKERNQNITLLIDDAEEAELREHLERILERPLDDAMAVVIQFVDNSVVIQNTY